jgi:hypothetical protein
LCQGWRGEKEQGQKSERQSLHDNYSMREPNRCAMPYHSILAQPAAIVL